MRGSSVYMRCASCRTVNSVAVQKIGDEPKCGRCGSFLAFPRGPVEIRDATFHAEITDWPGVSLVFFWAPWCAHCRSMIPSINEIAREKAGMLKVGMINTEKEVLLARKFDVLSVPRLMLFQGSRVIAEVNGAMRKDQIEGWAAGFFRSNSG